MIGTPWTSSITKYGPAGVGGAGVEHLGDVRVVHQRQRLPLGLEAGDDLPGVHARLDDLQRDLAADGVLLLGHEDDAEAALADLLQQLVAADDRADALGRRGEVAGRADAGCFHQRPCAGNSSRISSASAGCSARVLVDGRALAAAVAGGEVVGQLGEQLVVGGVGSALGGSDRVGVASLMAAAPSGRRASPPGCP